MASRSYEAYLSGFGLGTGLNQVNRTIYGEKQSLYPLSRPFKEYRFFSNNFCLEILTCELFKKGRSFWTYPRTD
jgi:hypothetical protein